jgi:hypothetical protein
MFSRKAGVDQQAFQGAAQRAPVEVPFGEHQPRPLARDQREIAGLLQVHGDADQRRAGMDGGLHRPGPAVRDGDVGQRVDQVRRNVRREQTRPESFPSRPGRTVVVAITD